MYQNTEIKEVALDNPLYPEKVKAMENAPKTLYWRGFFPDNRPTVAVIGARFCSSYGRFMARTIGQGLANNGCSVINGMALGIDGISLKAALDAGGLGYAVFGCGADVCYPPENMDLYDALLKKGGIISMFEPGTKPYPDQFVKRNALIAALADAVIVVEARRKSATLTLVENARKLGKKVYAVPGRLTDRLSDGTLEMLKQGATLFCSAEQVAEDLDTRISKEVAV